MKKVLVIDNYDSFTYNLVHYVEKITGTRPRVVRNDEINLEEVDGFDGVILSPGPGIPLEAGICLQLIREYGQQKSILGVCLGHQAIGEAFGASLLNLSKVYHGISTPVTILAERDKLFRNLPETFQAGRYHSWVVDRNSLPDCLHVTCEDENGLIMGLTHRTFDVRGVQFHPESVLTEHGISMIRNWLE